MENIVAALLSNDNATRSEAEKAFSTQQSSNPTGTFESLLGLLLASPSTNHRSLCLVLLKRLVREEKEFYKNLSAEAKVKTRQALLQKLAQDEDVSVRKKVALLIAELASKSTQLKAENASQDDGWSDLTQHLTALVGNELEINKVSGLSALNYLAEYDGQRVIPHSADFCRVVAPIMAGNGDVGTRIAALQAVCSLLQAKETIEKEFEELIPGMMSVISAALQGKQESVVQDGIKALLDVLETHPRFLRNNLTGVSEFVTQHIVANDDVQEETQGLALELVCTVAEKAQMELRKSPKVIESLVRVGMEVIAKGVFLKGIEESNEENEDFFDLEEDFRRAGEDLIARISKTVGSKLILPITFDLINKFLAEQSWKLRTSALITISLVSEKGGPLFFEKIVHIVEMITKFIKEKTSERVTFTAVHSLAILFYNFNDMDYEMKMKCAIGALNLDATYEELEEEEEEQLMRQYQTAFAHPVMEALSDGLSSNDLQSFSWKIKQEIASTLLALFSCVDDKEVVKAFAEPLLNGLFQIIQSSPQELFSVKVEGLTTVSSLAQVLQTDFGKYYDHFMPIAKELIKFCADNANQLPENCEALRGKAMDCVGLLGASVKKQKFEPDARFVLDLLINSTKSANVNATNFYAFASGISGDVPGDEDVNQESKEYIVRASCRIVTTMGALGEDKSKTAVKKFSEYLAPLVPPLLQMANEKVNISVSDNYNILEPGQNNDSKGIHSMDINFRGLGEKRIEFNTFAMQDKELALNMMYAYSETYEEYFMPYALQTARVILPELLSPMYHVRLASTFCVPKAMNALAKGFYLAHGLKSSFESTDAKCVLLTDDEFKFLQQNFKQSLEANGFHETQLSEVNQGLLQSVFDEFLRGLLDSLEFVFEEEEEFTEEEADLFDEDDDDEEILLISAESLASLIRVSFESGGMTDNNIDKMFSKDYELKNCKPLFYVTPDKLSEVLQKIIAIMQKRVEKRLKMVRFIQSLGDEADVQMIESLENSDRRMNEFLDSLSETVGCIIKSYAAIDPNAILTVFSQICHPFATELLKYPDSFEVASQLKAVGLFFYDDLVDFMGQSADIFIDFCAPHMISLCNHENFLVRQAACFGLGVCAEKSGPVFDKFVGKSLEQLKIVLSGPKAQKGSNSSATDNAISSLYKIVYYRQAALKSEGIDSSAMFNDLLTLLPLKADPIEAKVIHYKLTEHLKANDDVAKQFGPKIREVLLKAMKSKKADAKDVHSSILTENTRLSLQQLGP